MNVVNKKLYSLTNTIWQNPPPSNPNWQQWLLSTGSLTAKLEDFSQKKLIVQPDFEGRITLNLQQKQQLKLKLSRPHSAWLRKTQLYGLKHQPAWIMAYSIFPFHSLIGNARRLSNLGTMPIGYWIFQRHGATLKKRWIQQVELGWQRSSLYEWQGRVFLICEIFLYHFLHRLGHTDISCVSLKL